ncbi:ABC transporter ATP-binding protein [Cohnella thailandensis]|uniref:ABC transporter ATP-binding protein n=1 Tax=Cohnella thailandensis TaxID=557557 RepID=A0A841SW20_9BACL|nr:ABC transporter ATP-binding protein [Cohnella thailandensis]MBB6634060.1 ABC transporter ATP-binding protein [Cohnella thailandensis]MBP1972448.1 ABC-2 type transport system ATP-binding protein [Cohnella thailandensis]
MSDWIIETIGLSKSYKGRYAVTDLNLRIRPGDIYGFLGPNGAGKTTTIRMLLGLIKPTLGSVQLFGKPLHKARLEILRQVGSLVEYPSYYGHLTATENLEAIRRIIDVPKSRIGEVLEIVGLAKEARRAVKGYSLGMKQRLGIASALLGQPKLLILDEPTNGLDPSGILEIRELIKSMPSKYGITVLISSHLLSEVEQMAGTVGIIRNGALVFQDSMPSLRRQAQSSISLRVSEPERALAKLKGGGLNATLAPASGFIELASCRDDEVALIVRGLMERGHDIYRVEERRKSLEDLFLQIVEGGKPS